MTECVFVECASYLQTVCGLFLKENFEFSWLSLYILTHRMIQKSIDVSAFFMLNRIQLFVSQSACGDTNETCKLYSCNGNF